MIADLAFDIPLARSFSYAVPSGIAVGVGQRVSAPLHGRARVGIVVALREGEAAGLRAIERPVESAPIASGSALAVARWAAEESLSSLGSTLLSLLPPVLPGRAGEPIAPAPPPPARPAAATRPELWTSAARHADLVGELPGPGSALVIAPDREGAARWAERLEAARLDSGESASARRAAWLAAARGRARIVVGTRSALLVPLPPPATLVLVDEHDPGHKPPGAPRIHSRELLERRAAIEGSRLLLLSATPSAESWWRADEQQLHRRAERDGPWPEVVTADTRGLRGNHPLTLPLTRAIEDTARAGGTTALIVTRRAATLLCVECGHVFRCPDCGVAFPYSRREALLRCPLCARAEPLPEQCPGCGGHRFKPLGWDADRVEAAVRRRFPKLTVSRTDARSQVVVIAAPTFLRALPPACLGAVGIVSLDGVLGAADFRGGERAFALLWAAAEATSARGRVVAQTLHPHHYAIEAVQAQSRSAFYGREIALRAELGYPPFRRLCTVSVRGKREGEARALIAECARALEGVPGLLVYPPLPGAPGALARWRFAIKGPAELPRLLAEPLAPFLERRRRPAGVIEVEMDPI